MIPKVILIGHKKRQGKDTFAGYLQKHLEKFDVPTVQTSFAWPMKKIVAEALDVDMETLDSMKNCNSYYRSMLQNFGSGHMKQYFGDTVWRDLAMKEIEALGEDGFKCVIISDFRFPCEYIDGATTINVNRDGGNGDSHISETALDGYEYDYTVDNSGSLSWLDDMALHFAHSIALGQFSVQQEDAK